MNVYVYIYTYTYTCVFIYKVYDMKYKECNVMQVAFKNTVEVVV